MLTILKIVLQVYAKQKLRLKNDLLSYAGMLNEDDAEELLKQIKTNRCNKE